MNIIEGKAMSQDVAIHFITSSPVNTDKTPLLIIPGLTEAAEDYLEVMQQLDRKCVVISLRGRGKSDSPLSGYTLEDHIQDIEAVVEKANLDEFILYGFSRGASYMFGYAVKHPHNIRGIMIGDYPAVHTKLPEGWVDFFVNLPPWLGKSTLERIQRHALEGLQRESVEKEFWKDLSSFDCPVFLLRGAQKGAVMTNERLHFYQDALPSIEIVTFEDTGHNLFAPDINRFIRTLQGFLEKIS